MSNTLQATANAIADCRGDRLVASFFSATEHEAWFAQPWYLIAVGKAAGAMASAAVAMGQQTLEQGFVVGKAGSRRWFDDARVMHYKASHPIPDASSFAAGDALVSFVSALPQGARVLFLLSGGASALVEVLSDDMNAAQWQEQTAQWLASGWDIARINAERKSLSCIKGGKLLALFPSQCTLLQLVVSDVQGDDLATIGSGLLAGKIGERQLTTHIVANNHYLLSRLVDYLPTATLMPDFVSASVDDLAAEIVAVMARPSSCSVWGGEPVVVLPEQFGRGGRMQHLALLVAWLLRDAHYPWQFIALGSDGSDGATEDAGAMVNQDTVKQVQQQGWDIEAVLGAFDAGSLLDDVGALITTGDTGTNVNDVMVFCRE
jgi:hydroxypyruvate reductase